MARPSTSRNKSKAFRAGKAKLLATATCCHICGQPVDKSAPYYIHDGGLRTINPEAPVVDHIVPWSTHTDKAHADRASNLALAHARCNRAKSDKPFAPILKADPSLD